MLWLPDQERERIGAWARDDSPRESCGVLIGRPQGGGAVWGTTRIYLTFP